MAIVNGYTTLADLKNVIRVTDTVDDAFLERVITSSSRAIDHVCERRFYAVTETRYYTPIGSYLVRIDDILSVTSLLTDEDGDRVYEVTWATMDYDLEPSNAALDGQPYTQLRVAPNGRYIFPLIARAVRLNGSFGFSSATPADIQAACEIMAIALLRRPDAPFGVAGADQFGHAVMIARRDPHISMLLGPFRRVEV